MHHITPRRRRKTPANCIGSFNGQPIAVADAIHIRGWLLHAICPSCDEADAFFVGDKLAAIHSLRCFECGETFFVTPAVTPLIAAAGGDV